MDLRKPKLQWRKAVPSSRLNHSVKVSKNTLLVEFFTCCFKGVFFVFKNVIKISCWLFREEVVLFWRGGVRTLYWGGLFQRWASFLSSPRWSHAAAGTMFPSHLSDFSGNLPWKTTQCCPSIAGEKMHLGFYLGEWEELSWCTEKDIGGMHIGLQRLNVRLCF